MQIVQQLTHDHPAEASAAGVSTDDDADVLELRDLVGGVRRCNGDDLLGLVDEGDHAIVELVDVEVGGLDVVGVG